MPILANWPFYAQRWPLVARHLHRLSRLVLMTTSSTRGPRVLSSWPEGVWPKRAQNRLRHFALTFAVSNRYAASGALVASRSLTTKWTSGLGHMTLNPMVCLVLSLDAFSMCYYMTIDRLIAESAMPISRKVTLRLPSFCDPIAAIVLPLVARY